MNKTLTIFFIVAFSRLIKMILGKFSPGQLPSVNFPDQIPPVNPPRKVPGRISPVEVLLLRLTLTLTLEMKSS